MPDLRAQCRKAGITARKYGGDDRASWAVFMHGRPCYTGLTRAEVPYYQRLLLKHHD